MNADTLFTTCLPVVENLFRRLSARELSCCAQVCKVWHSMSVAEWERRQHLDWFLQEGCPPVDSLHPFQEKINNSRIKSSICLVFLTPDTYCDLRPVTPQRKKAAPYSVQLQRVAARLLKPILPSDCKIHCITHSRIIGCHDDLSPIEMESGSNVAGILIPKYPGVDISHVYLDEWSEAREKGELLKGPIKCLLVMTDNQHMQTAIKLVQDCCKSQRERFVCGGGFVDNCNSAFIFRGENVEAASIILDITKEGPAIAEEMKLFLKTGLLDNECFCFVFNCDKYFSNAPNILVNQSDIFHKIYPKVPLFGVYSSKVFGAFYLPHVDPEEKWYKEKEGGFEHFPRISYAWYVLISIKKPKK